MFCRSVAQLPFFPVVMLIVGAQVQAAPTERAVPPRSSASAQSDSLERRRPEGRAAGRGDGSAASEKRVQMLKVISVLEGMHRTFNSTLSARIAFVPRASARNSGRKNKTAAVTSTTGPPAAADSTASGASAGVLAPGLTGRNFRKSLPPQSKKTNKRVCFWKYCSQN